MEPVDPGVAVGAVRGDAVIEFPADSPHDADVTKLVEGIARDTYSIDTPSLKVFTYVDDGLAIFETDALEESGFFSEWFGGYYEGHRTLWEESHIVVFSETIEGLDQVRYHVVLGQDFPVYALCVNRTTGEAQWYLQETPAAQVLSSKMR